MSTITVQEITQTLSVISKPLTLTILQGPVTIGGSSGSGNEVLFTAQTLTSPQKVQATTNINAATISQLSGVANSISLFSRQTAQTYTAVRATTDFVDLSSIPLFIDGFDAESSQLGDVYVLAGQGFDSGAYLSTYLNGFTKLLTFSGSIASGTHAGEYWVCGPNSAIKLGVTVAHTQALSTITQSGAAVGDNPRWSGTAWVPAAPSGGGGSIAAINITDSTVAGRALLTAANATAQRTALGLATVATTGNYSDLTGAPAAGGAGGSPGGSSTQPQYNNAGAFAGMAANYYPPGSGGSGPASNGLLALAGGLRVGPETHNAGISNGCGYFSGALEVDGDFYLGGSFIPSVNVAINLQGSAVTSSLIKTGVAGETSTRFYLTASGGMQWSSGAGAQDVFLSRGAAGRLDIGGTLKLTTYTLAMLNSTYPSPAVAQESFITDETTGAFGAVCVGGGTIETPVTYRNGAWRNG